MSSLWDEGDIAQAVTKAKNLGAIFVVFVEGENELSVQYGQFFENEDILNKLKSKHFVAIKVQENSVPHQQFKAIYPHSSSPSVFFIGKSGKPLKIVSENIQINEFKEVIESILEKNSEDDGASTSSSMISNEKIQHAKELIEKKREDKKKQEEENERLKEMERRKMGQNVQQMKRWQQDEELKQLKEERDREKRENLAARERILAQIAQDKAERAAKFSQQSTNIPQISQQQQQPRIEPKSDVTRLQFRLPDGSSHTNDFQISDSLEIVHQYIRNEMNLPFTNYTLSTTFPRREFTENDRSQTLLDLQLVPNAVILIIPQNQGSSVSSNTSGLIGSAFWWLLTPLFNIYDYLIGLIYGTPPRNRSVESTSSKRTATEMSDSSRSVPKKQANDSTMIKRQGNIHRLKDRPDNDDDNNTWNGNSTQQM